MSSESLGSSPDIPQLTIPDKQLDPEGIKLKQDGWIFLQAFQPVSPGSDIARLTVAIQQYQRTYPEYEFKTYQNRRDNVRYVIAKRK